MAELSWFLADCGRFGFETGLSDVWKAFDYGEVSVQTVLSHALQA